jgi:hypothetical protein
MNGTAIGQREITLAKLLKKKIKSTILIEKNLGANLTLYKKI